MVKKRSFLLPVFLVGGLFAAQDPKEIKFKSRDLEKVNAELNQKKEERQRLGREADELSEAVKASESKIRNYETSLMYTKQKGVQIELALATTKNQSDKLASQVTHQRVQLKEAFKTYQVASLLATPDSRTAVLSRQILNAQGTQLRNMLGRKDETQEDLRSLVDTHLVIRSELKKQEEKLSSIKAVTEDRERLLTKKKSRQEVLETEMKELQQTAEQLASLIDVLRTKAKEEAEAEREERRVKQASGHSPIPSGSLPWPISGNVATRFGRQQHPTSGTTFISNGIVITSPESQSIAVVAKGKVLYSGEFMSYGNMVVLEHPGDWYTVYGQMVNVTAEKGQEVNKGDLIGMARPRASGGVEAYFELRFYGKSTNPLPWMTK